MAREDTDLPFGDAFGPAQLSVDDDEDELVVLLDLAKEHEGDPDSFDRAVADRFFTDSSEPLVRAKNVRLGMRTKSGYGIIDNDIYFTDLGEELFGVREDIEQMYDRFARHILNNLHGLKIIQIIDDLEEQGKKTTNNNIKQELRDQYDFHIDKTSNHWSQMRAWLAKAGILNTGHYIYDIDREKLEELVGFGTEEVLQLDELTEEQAAFLKALTLIDPDGEIPNSVVRKVAESAYGVNISQSNISRRTLDPLQDQGYIEWEHKNGKPNPIRTTEKFDAELLKPVLDDVSERTGVPRDVLRMSFSEIEDDLDSDSTFKKGTALETLTIKLGRLLGLEFVGWRVRGRKTGNSEVDVVFDQVDTTFNRWQIQCKNIKKQVEAKQVAREVGITRVLQTNTLLIVARGGVSPDAHRFAAQVMKHENISILFLTDEDLSESDDREDRLLTTLKQKSRRVQRLKKLDESDFLEASESGVSSDDEKSALTEYQDEIEKHVPESDSTTLGDFDSDI